MKTHRIAGGGGVQLHVVEAGNPGGPPILFVHGLSQSWLSWSRQLDSDLANDNDDLLPGLRKPVLITHGGNDAIVKPEAAEQHKAGLARVDVQIMPGIGHAPFWENAAAFNQRLRAFVETCQGA